MSARKAKRQPKAQHIERCSHCLAPASRAVRDAFADIAEDSYQQMLTALSILETVEVGLDAEIEGVHLLFSTDAAMALLREAVDALALNELEAPEREVRELQRRVAKQLRLLDDVRERLLTFNEDAIGVHARSFHLELAPIKKVLYVSASDVFELPTGRTTLSRRTGRIEGKQQEAQS